MNDKTSTRIARNISRAEVLKVIRAEGTISRSRLTRMVPVSRATVSSVVSELILTGILEEVGEGESTGGRPPMRLRYHPESRLAIGVVLAGGFVQAVLTDLDGRPVSEYLTATVGGADPGAMLAAMADVTRQILKRTSPDRVMGIGVGTPGIVDFDGGIIEVSVSQKWLGGEVKVRDTLERELGLPVYVANRSRVAALGECRVGVGCNVSNLIYLFLGQGVVAGVVIDGHLFSGSGSSAGEVGHVSIVPDGPLCDCGNRGCLEVYASESAILANARSLAREDQGSLLQQVVDSRLEQLTMDQVIDAANLGDVCAKAAIDEAGEKIGMAVSTLIDLFNPEMVILGGPTGHKAGALLLEPVTREAQRRALPRPYRMTQIVTGTLDTNAAAIGAAVLAIDHTPVDTIFGIH